MSVGKIDKPSSNVVQGPWAGGPAQPLPGTAPKAAPLGPEQTALLARYQELFHKRPESLREGLAGNPQINGAIVAFLLKEVYNGNPDPIIHAALSALQESSHDSTDIA